MRLRPKLSLNWIGRRRRAGRPLLSVLGSLVLTGSPIASPSYVTAETGDLLPDLAMARPLDLRVEISSGGRRLLRLTTMIVNIGDGPLETRASRQSATEATMGVKQRIYDTSGGYRAVNTTAIAAYTGGGHGHWHVQHVARYELYAMSGLQPALARSSKAGFCFFDTRRYRATLPNAPSSRHYQARGCGSPDALSVTHGISVGWADRYGWDLRYQAIDVTRLPAGDYLLKVTADPNGYFLEGNVTNNCNWTRIRLRRSGALVSVLDWGAGCTLPGVTPMPSPTPMATQTHALDVPVDWDDLAVAVMDAYRVVAPARLRQELDTGSADGGGG